MSECNLYGRNRPDMYLFTHEQLVSMVNEAYSYGEHGIDTADFRIKCEDFGPNFVPERTCKMTTDGIDPSWQGEELYPVDMERCSACGEFLYAVNTRNYCPKCGAKVVEE